MSNIEFDVLDLGLVYYPNIIKDPKKIIDAVEDLDKRADRLTELNVIEQVKNLCRTKKVQKAWKERSLQVHGWVYGLNSGLVKDLQVVHDEINDIESIYRYEL